MILILSSSRGEGQRRRARAASAEAAADAAEPAAGGISEPQQRRADTDGRRSGHGRSSKHSGYDAGSNFTHHHDDTFALLLLLPPRVIRAAWASLQVHFISLILGWI